MIASGLSKMRESTSPGRMPPRARHRIWSNSQPELCTFSASRSMSMWYSSQETYRCLPSSVSMNGSSEDFGQTGLRLQARKGCRSRIV